MGEKDSNTTTIVQDANRAVKTEITPQIRVTVHVPDHLHERVRQQKINRIYDILTP